MGRPLGPGPGAYLLPSAVGYDKHDSTRYRYPMYSFGTKGAGGFRSLGPGPTYKIDMMTREGRVTAPAWSLASRFQARGITKTPGPGAHAPERCPPMKNARAPAYSLGARLGRDSKRAGPAANAYALKSSPDGPAYSMAARLGKKEPLKSPGPAVYFQKDALVFKTAPPKYSLGARLGFSLKTQSPGPATYPPKMYNSKKTAQSWSFGVHHSPWSPPMIIDEDEAPCI